MSYFTKPFRSNNQGIPYVFSFSYTLPNDRRMFGAHTCDLEIYLSVGSAFSGVYLAERKTLKPSVNSYSFLMHLSKASSLLYFFRSTDPSQSCGVETADVNSIYQPVTAK